LANAGTKVAVIQPSYIPWRGYFHQIQKADTFVFYDDVQYDEHGWRNRNCTRFERSSHYSLHGEKTDRLLQLLQAVGADHYISGPSARGYLEERKLAAAGISLEYMSYDYPEHTQLHPPYDPQVTILDVLLMLGPEAPDFTWRGET